MAPDEGSQPQLRAAALSDEASCAAPLVDLEKLTLMRLGTPSDAIPYLPLAFPAFRPRLLALGQDQGVIAIGAALDGEPVGLVVAQRDENAVAQVVSLAVRESYRRQGIGGRLFAEIERVMRDEGVEHVYLVFTEPSGGAAAMRRLLARQGWSDPRPRMHLITMGRGTLQLMQGARWIRQRQLPDGCEIFPWSELTAEEEAELRNADEQSAWFPSQLSPFATHDPIDPRISVGLRYKGNLIGWFIVHRIADGTVRYTSLFVRPTEGLRSGGMVLLSEAVRRHLADPGEDQAATFGIHVENSLIRFVERHILPHVELLRRQTSQISHKRFSALRSVAMPLAGTNSAHS